MRRHGRLKVAEIKKLGGPENSAAILGRNFYKWYAKIEDPDSRYPHYEVTEKGLAALAEYADLFGE